MRLGVVDTVTPSTTTCIAAASPPTTTRQSPAGSGPAKRSSPPLRTVTPPSRARTVSASASASGDVGPMVDRTTPSGVAATARAARQLKRASMSIGS
jgi:hypothetical protein